MLGRTGFMGRKDRTRMKVDKERIGGWLLSGVLSVKTERASLFPGRRGVSKAHLQNGIRQFARVFAIRT